MKKPTKNKKLVVGRETVKALTPGEFVEVEGGNEVPIPITGDSRWVCCA
jgi:hypothetical protein